MDITARRRKITKTQLISDSLSDLYPHDVNMYKFHPDGNIQLAEFQDIALERLQLFRIIEQANLIEHKQYSEEWKQTIKQNLAKANLKKFIRLMSGYSSTNSASDLDYQARRADHISHFILRLAYCRSEELRRWFLNRELEWFKLKFIAQSQVNVKLFLQLNNLHYTPISTEEKDDIKIELIASTPGLSEASVHTSEFYKVDFSDVCPLVSARKVYLKAGFAYVSLNDLVVVIQSKFRWQLSEALNIYHHKLSYFDDERINPLLVNLHNMHTGKTYTIQTDKEKVDPSDIDSLSKQHFPLCMKHMHNILKTNHHLKHNCRLTYGLFLKGIGFLYEDALIFWREEFTKIMDSNKFDKEYAYNIGHQYGKVGSRINYTPYSCIKIISSTVGPGEHHGCPFKHWDAAIVKQKILEYGVNNQAAQEIVELASSGHFQIACGKYFEYTHGKPPTNAIGHPNQYFEESMNLAKDKK